MNHNPKQQWLSTARNTMVGFLALTTFAFGQTTTTSGSSSYPTTTQQSAGTSGGWKRVGESAQVLPPDNNSGLAEQDQDPNQAGYPTQQPIYGQQNQGSAGQYPAAGQQQYPQQQYPQQQYPQQQYPQQQQPNARYNQQAQGNPPPVPSQLTVQPGTYLTVRVNQMLSSDKNQPGDAFTASLIQPLVVNGVVVAEPGQTIGGRVVTAEKHNLRNTGRLGIQLTNLTLVDGQQIPIATQFTSRTGRTTSGGTEVGTVAATTATGAAIGAIAGWGTGAAIGAGAGAAAGLIGVLVTHNHASVIYPEQILTFSIQERATISTERSTQAFRYVQPNEYDRPVYTNEAGGGLYESASPAPPVYNNYYAGGYGWGWGYPYYWGPSFAFYGGYWGGYPYRYWGGRGYFRGGYYGGGRGYYGGGRGYAGGGYVAGGARFSGGAAHFSGGGARGGGGHR